MAVRSVCEHCGRPFSAPDETLGKKIDCPSCGRRARVLAPEALEALAREREEKARWQEEQDDRIRLVEEMDARESVPGSHGGLAVSVSNFQPKAGKRHPRLRAFSRILLVLAYMELGLGFLLLWFTVVSEPTESYDWVSIAAILAVALFTFGVLKFLSEACIALAEIGDHQSDVRALLLDERHDRERVLSENESGGDPP